MYSLRGAVIAVAVFLLGCAVADPEFCDRGFQIAQRFQTCWEDATFTNPYHGFGEDMQLFTPKMFEDYATHMCRAVKPVAMKCLQREVTQCDEHEKLMAIADESGGACQHDNLNPFFKLHVIDHLQPIRRDSQCFLIAQNSYNCYEKAGEEVLASGVSHVDIIHFHKVADKFFGSIWDCHIELFKSNRDVCSKWQIPMLLALQKTAMPSLFGMKLNNYQVAKLELEPADEREMITAPTTTENPSTDCDKEEEVTSYILLRVIKNKKEAKVGDIVVELNAHGKEREISVVSGPSMSEDVNDLVKGILDSEGRLDMRKLRHKMREQKKKQKEINEYLTRIRQAEKKRMKAIARKEELLRRKGYAIHTEGLDGKIDL